jgi:hypothetical protein
MPAVPLAGEQIMKRFIITSFSSFRLLHQSWVQISSLNTLSQLSTTYVSVRPKHIKNQDGKYAFQTPHFQTATGKKQDSELKDKNHCQL